MYKQKGTGGARHGSRRAPQFVGGSRAFGPVVRDHGFSLPKKVRALALRHALSAKVVAGDLVVVDSLTLKDAKTAGLRETLGKLGWTRTLFIAGPEVDTNFGLAAAVWTRDMHKYIFTVFLYFFSAWFFLFLKKW